MAKTVKVGIADLNIVTPPDVLISYALGSCVGICLYDPKTKVTGLSHILLPRKSPNDSNEMKCADTAIPLLIKKMEKVNVAKERIVAKIAGGANMFANISQNAMSQIGLKNVKTVKQILNELNIPIIAEDTGGTYGRTIEFHAETGILYVRSVSREQIAI